MCGRAILVSSVEEIASIFEVPLPVSPDLALPPRFNIAPGQDLVVVRRPPPLASSTNARSARELARVRWGLVPWWSKDTKISARCIQARAETIARAPAFRDSFESRRCLVVVSGFYEWSGAGNARQPHHVHLPGNVPFAIAGVWDSWTSPEGAVLETCAVVTTAARGPMVELHDRMPLVLDGDAREQWLSASTSDAQALAADVDRFVAIPVSTWVNDVKHDDERCLAPPELAPEPRGQTAFRFG